jgi:cell division septation protein DedD
MLAIRIPRAGGAVRAYAYPRLDSTVWTSRARAPAVERVLAFDPNGGAIAALDARGAPIRIDLRLGGVTREATPKLTKVTSLDGAAIFGIGQNGTVNRLTPAGAWQFKPPIPARDIVPQLDGSILVLADRGQSTVVWHLFPPETRITDTAVVPRASRVVPSAAGDRLYLTTDTALIGLRGRDLAPVPRVELERKPRSVVTTPSGDRIYLALDSAPQLMVIDRYSGDVDARIELPGIPSELRMDPTGRYVLARPGRADSAWVIAIGNDNLIGAVATAWRSDLPAVAPDGSIALVRGADVVLVDGETLQPGETVRNGARDAWHFILWDGFRPRPTPTEEELAVQPPEAPVDSAAPANPFEGAEVPADSAPPPRNESAGSDTPRDTARPPAFTIQFAALRDESAARETARRLQVDGATPRVVTTVRDGITIYRVVAGPFPTRADAERVAYATGQSFWIYEGAP